LSTAAPNRRIKSSENLGNFTRTEIFSKLGANLLAIKFTSSRLREVGVGRAFHGGGDTSKRESVQRSRMEQVVNLRLMIWFDVSYRRDVSMAFNPFAQP
jgi:hypothetical protein